MNVEDWAEQHVGVLAREIGPRPSGSTACAAAADYIEATLARLGLPVERQTFDCPTWSYGAAELTIGDARLEVLPNPYTPPCDVTAPLVPVSTLAGLEAADLTGRIALLYGDLTRAPIACKSWFLKDERDERIIALLEQKAPLAVLTVQAQPGSIDRILEDWEFALPSATLPALAAREALRRPGGTAHLCMVTHQQPGSTANLVARIPGSRPEKIVLCAHYDTKVDTPGALDNATGIAALLCLAAVFTRQTLRQAGLELVAFSNEEYLPIGDDTYLARGGEAGLAHTLLAVNFDGMGHCLDVNTLAIFTASPEFEAEARAAARGFPNTEWVEPWPQSNHSTFAWRGAPALAFSSRAGWPLHHQREDTVDWVSAARVAEAVALTEQIARAVEDRPLAWLRPR